MPPNDLLESKHTDLSAQIEFLDFPDVINLVQDEQTLRRCDLTVHILPSLSELLRGDGMAFPQFAKNVHKKSNSL
jgi:hypothetical protein